MIDAVVGEPVGQVVGNVARTIVAQQPRPVGDRCFSEP